MRGFPTTTWPPRQREKGENECEFYMIMGLVSSAKGQLHHSQSIESE
uniref:Uncharacterized protein n=1 Tax=Lotus japonicus TaxID=34305 RepID=I3T3R0_LOTJA|nr:unknown [Lotus japonicus]